MDLLRYGKKVALNSYNFESLIVCSSICKTDHVLYIIIAGMDYVIIVYK